jgi:hypothetical protein
MLDEYNAILKEEYGEDITVKLVGEICDDGLEVFYYTSAKYGDSGNVFKTVKEAYADACTYLCYVGELW